MSHWESCGALSRRFGYFYGSSVALEMGFGGSHRLQTDFRMDSIDELGGGYFHLCAGEYGVPSPLPIGCL